MQRASLRRPGGRRPAVAPVQALLVCLALFSLVLAAYWTARLAWADHLSRSSEVEDRRRAVSLVPADATLDIRLAEALEDAGADPLPSLQAAVRLDPDNPEWRMALAQRAEWAGDFALAEHSLLEAARRSRLYQPKYLLAGYYFRRGNADQCLGWSQEALNAAPGDVTPVLACMGRLLDVSAMAAYGMRQRFPIARQFLTYLVGQKADDAAAPLGRRLARTGAIEDLPAVLAYANQLLADGRARDAAEIWNVLCRRRLLPYQPLDPASGQLLTNGDFQFPPLAGGFDWHAEGAPGIRSVVFEGGLRASFSGLQPDDCVVAWQYVALAMGGRYRLSVEMEAEDAAAAHGLTWRIFYPRGQAAWGPLDADLTQGFRAPAEAVRLALIYRRPIGVRRLSGEILVSRLRLEREP